MFFNIVLNASISQGKTRITEISENKLVNFSGVENIEIFGTMEQLLKFCTFYVNTLIRNLFQISVMIILFRVLGFRKKLYNRNIERNHIMNCRKSKRQQNIEEKIADHNI